jgi:hypothetical protein
VLSGQRLAVSEASPLEMSAVTMNISWVKAGALEEAFFD